MWPAGGLFAARSDRFNTPVGQVLSAVRFLDTSIPKSSTQNPSPGFSWDDASAIHLMSQEALMPHNRDMDLSPESGTFPLLPCVTIKEEIMT